MKNQSSQNLKEEIDRFEKLHVLREFILEQKADKEGKHYERALISGFFKELTKSVADGVLVDKMILSTFGRLDSRSEPKGADDLIYEYVGGEKRRRSDEEIEYFKEKLCAQAVSVSPSAANMMYIDEHPTQAVLVDLLDVSRGNLRKYKVLDSVGFVSESKVKAVTEYLDGIENNTNYKQKM
jgi:hypothetical protein